MKTLQNFINENLLAESEDLKSAVDEFIRKNYTWTKGFTISNKPNKDGKYEVYCAGNLTVENSNITELTNDLFIWNNVSCSGHTIILYWTNRYSGHSYNIVWFFNTNFRLFP